MANLHKWALVPAPAGFIYAAEKYRNKLYSPIVGHSHEGPYTERLTIVGTMDYSPYLVIPDALKMLKDIGMDKIWEHNHKLVMQGSGLIASKLGTECATDDKHTGFMRAIRLNMGAEKAAEWTEALLQNGFVAPVIPVGDQAWVRVSAQIYNNLDEYMQLAEALEALTKGQPIKPYQQGKGKTP